MGNTNSGEDDGAAGDAAVPDVLRLDEYLSLPVEKAQAVVDTSRARLENADGLTKSTHLRTQGNEAFGQAYLKGVGRDMRLSKLAASSAKYYGALSAAGNADDQATAL
jgi:hypothetical protein